MSKTRPAPFATPTETIAACAMLLGAIVVCGPIHADEPHRSPGIGMAVPPGIAADRRAPAHDDATRPTTRITATVVRADGTPDDGGVVLHSNGECQPQWLPTFGPQPGVNGTVYALTVFDDGSGSGPAVYAGGALLTAGAVSVPAAHSPPPAA